MNATELITSKGYPCENHYATTKDGFILNMQRIPHGRHHSTPKNTGKERPVILIQHGLETSSTCWLDNLVNESLAYLLADQDVDVWLGNARGNVYSLHHVKYSSGQREFWDWSFDEMALYDLPAMIDYIVGHTGVKQIHYLGHSQGSLMGFAGFSCNHTLASLVKRFYALAPIAKVHNIRSPIRILAPWANDLYELLHIFGYNEFLPYDKHILDILAKDICFDLSDVLCANILFILCGFDRSHLNESRIPVYIGQNPAGTSVMNILHFAQGVNVDKFQMFDYGTSIGNMLHYKQGTPPEYNLSRFNVPTVTYSGGHDLLADPVDVSWVLDEIRHSLLASHVYPKWEHLDFIWAFDAVKYCYQDVLRWVLKN